jgi:hypothetical protein
MRKQVRRKVWKLVDPIVHAIEGASITAEEHLNKLRLMELAAIEAMIKGHGTLEDWKSLCDVLNIAEIMGENGIGPEVLPICAIVQEEMAQAATRYEQTRKMGLTGQGIKALKELYEYHDLQRTSISRSEYERMIKKTGDYIRGNSHRVRHIT